MGLLDQLWDDTVAGPRPDTGLGKLRKHATFSFRSIPAKELEIANSGRSFREEGDAAKVMINKIFIKPSQLNQDSPPVSPAGSTPPISPLPGGEGKEAFWSRRRRSTSFAYEKAGGVGPRSPPPLYDL